VIDHQKKPNILCKKKLFHQANYLQNLQDIGTDIDFAFSARPGRKSSQGGINGKVSEPVCEVLGGVSGEISSNMSVAELQSCEQNGMVSGQICDIVIGQSESLKCTAKNVQIVTILAESR
jgi:hypothetical protein